MGGHLPGHLCGQMDRVVLNYLLLTLGLRV